LGRKIRRAKKGFALETRTKDSILCTHSPHPPRITPRTRGACPARPPLAARPSCGVLLAGRDTLILVVICAKRGKRAYVSRALFQRALNISSGKTYRGRRIPRRRQLLLRLREIEPVLSVDLASTWSLCPSRPTAPVALDAKHFCD
jgi:hypothetical protein